MSIVWRWCGWSGRYDRLYMFCIYVVYGEEIGSLYITINTTSLDLAWSNSLLNSKDNLDFVSKTSD